VQECADLTYLAFDLADQYRMPVILLADGMIGQMMEGVVLPRERDLSELPKRDWTVGHMADRETRHITSLDLAPEELERKTRKRFARYEEIKRKEVRYEAAGTENAELTCVAYGTCARVALGAKKLAEQEGFRLGVFRPITLWPFPSEGLGAIAETGKPVLTVEMSLGQLVEDVKLAVLGKGPVHLLGHSGGVIPTEEEVFAEAKRIIMERRRIA
jgi:2-oxoglutarate ferredoxin oxidoreductase subunit alpha